MGTELDKPRALTPEVQARIIQYMVDGNYYGPSCVAAGTTKQTVEYWRKLFDAGAEHAQTYADFFGALARAQSIAEVNAVSDMKTGRPGWQAQAWFLERRYPKRWLTKERAKAAEKKLDDAIPNDEDGNPIDV